RPARIDMRNGGRRRDDEVGVTGRDGIRADRSEDLVEFFRGRLIDADHQHTLAGECFFDVDVHSWRTSRSAVTARSNSASSLSASAFALVRSPLRAIRSRSAHILCKRDAPTFPELL